MVCKGLYLAGFLFGGVAVFNGFCILVNRSPRTSAWRGDFSFTRTIGMYGPEAAQLEQPAVHAVGDEPGTTRYK